MTHSTAIAAELLAGQTIAYGRSQTAFTEDDLPIGAGLEDLGKGHREARSKPCIDCKQRTKIIRNGRRLCNKDCT